MPQYPEEWSRAQQEIWEAATTHGPTGLPYTIQDDRQLQEAFDLGLFEPGISTDDKQFSRQLLQRGFFRIGVNFNAVMPWERWRQLMGYE